MKHYDSINKARGGCENLFSLPQTQISVKIVLLSLNAYCIFWYGCYPPILELCHPKIDYLWHLRHFIKKPCWTPATTTRISPHSNRLLPYGYSPVRLKPSRLCMCEYSTGYRPLNTTVLTLESLLHTFHTFVGFFQFFLTPHYIGLRNREEVRGRT